MPRFVNGLKGPHRAGLVPIVLEIDLQSRTRSRMGRIQRQGLLIRPHSNARTVEILLGDLAKSELQLSRAGVVIGQLELTRDDPGQFFPIPRAPIQAVQRPQCLCVLLGRPQDVFVELDRLVRVVHLFFVERRELEANFALLLLRAGQSELLVVDGQQLVVLAGCNIQALESQHGLLVAVHDLQNPSVARDSRLGVGQLLLISSRHRGQEGKSLWPP